MTRVLMAAAALLPEASQAPRAAIPAQASPVSGQGPHLQGRAASRRRLAAPIRLLPRPTVCQSPPEERLALV